MKKIFYGAAIQGAKNRKERAYIHKLVIDVIKEMGCKVVTEHLTGTNFENTARLLEESLGPLPPVGKERSVFIRNKLIEFIEGDIDGAVFEVSTPSLGTGVEITHAYLRPRLGLAEIPVIALYQKDYWPNKLSTMIRGISKEKISYFQLIEYESPGDLKAIITSIIK